MPKLYLRIVCIAALTTNLLVPGINWKAVWLEKNPVVLTVGQTQPYTVMGLNGMNTTADLTKSPYLKITSSDPGVLEIHQTDALFVGKSPGKTEVRISFSEATAIVRAVVRESNDGSSAPQRER